MDNFTVTTGNKDTAELNRLTRAIALHDIWNRQYHNTVSSMFQKYKSLDDWSQDELMKVALLWTEKMVCWLIIRVARLQKWAISLHLCRLWSDFAVFKIVTFDFDCTYKEIIFEKTKETTVSYSHIFYLNKVVGSHYKNPVCSEIVWQLDMITEAWKSRHIKFGTNYYLVYDIVKIKRD